MLHPCFCCCEFSKCGARVAADSQRLFCLALLLLVVQQRTRNFELKTSKTFSAFSIEEFEFFEHHCTLQDDGIHQHTKRRSASRSEFSRVPNVTGSETSSNTGERSSSPRTRLAKVGFRFYACLIETKLGLKGR